MWAARGSVGTRAGGVETTTELLFFGQLMLMSYCVAELLLLFVVELFRKH